nr:NAC domain-containing protein [Tanacetum cinerariifolium]
TGYLQGVYDALLKGDSNGHDVGKRIILPASSTGGLRDKGSRFCYLFEIEKPFGEVAADKSALKNGDLEWFFFCPKSKKYNTGSRYNRATEIGFWKATGKDRTVTYKGRTVATIKTLVFYIGNSGKGERTDWVMHEYRLEDEQLSNAGVVQDTYVLVKLFEKAGSGPKNGAQYGAPFNEEEWENDDIANCSNALATVGPLEATTTNALGYKQKDKSALKNGDLEWFFFCPKSKKYNSGSRYNRATEIGFWKATGKDRMVTYKGRTVATIKTLVFHIGNSGKGERTDWVMHEYRLEDEQLSNAGPKNGAQYGAPFNEEEWENDDIANCSNALATVGPLEATTTNALGYKQKGPATVNMYEPGSSTVTCSANGTGNIVHYKQKGTAAMEMMTLEPESSIVTLSANERREEFSTEHGNTIAFCLGVSEGFTGNNENEVVQVENVEENGTMAPNAEDGIYNDLVNLINLDGGASASGSTPAVYMFDKPLDDLDFNLETFYVD